MGRATRAATEVAFLLVVPTPPLATLANEGSGITTRKINRGATIRNPVEKRRNQGRLCGRVSQIDRGRHPLYTLSELSLKPVSQVEPAVRITVAAGYR
jgi:hypothetical protein